MIRHCVIVAIAALLATGSPPSDLAGSWVMCLSAAGLKKPACDIVKVDSLRPTLSGESKPAMSYYRFRHDMALSSVLGDEGKGFGHFGTLMVQNSTDVINLWLGLDEGSVMGWDGGWVVAELEQRDDSLYGTWHRTCYDGCPEEGHIVFRRHLP